MRLEQVMRGRVRGDESLAGPQGTCGASQGPGQCSGLLPGGAGNVTQANGGTAG